MKFENVLHKFRTESSTQRDMGTCFERLMRSWLLSDARYSNLAEIWMWEDIPSKSDFCGKDTGICLRLIMACGRDKTYIALMITKDTMPDKPYEYVIKGKFTFEWIMERYVVTQ